MSAPAARSTTPSASETNSHKATPSPHQGLDAFCQAGGYKDPPQHLSERCSSSATMGASAQHAMIYMRPDCVCFNKLGCIWTARRHTCRPLALIGAVWPHLELEDASLVLWALLMCTKQCQQW